jgi:hypothetical protein
MKLCVKEDFFDKVFGKIRIIGLSGDPHSSSGCQLVYRCECGNEGRITAGILRKVAYPQCHECLMKQKIALNTSKKRKNHVI